MMTRWLELQGLCDRVLESRQIIVASNRGPVEHHVTSKGCTDIRRGSGGVVTALSSLTYMEQLIWIASTMGEGDRRVSIEGRGEPVLSPLPGQNLRIRFVISPRHVYHKFYNVFCNPILWFLQHYMWNSPYDPNIDASVHNAWRDGYVVVNENFAKVALEQIEGCDKPSVVMIHDYHLYLMPGMVRRSSPNSIIQYFIHIPWPTPRYWQLLPSYMIQGICQGLCGSDIVGFQTQEDVRNFLDTCEALMPGVEVNHGSKSVFHNGRETLVRVYPISINVEEIRRIALAPKTLDHEKRLAPLCKSKTIVRVDRADPSKNVVRGFRAYDLLLSRHPEWLGKVAFLAFLVPSRTRIRQYQNYLDEILQVVADINTTHGTPEWTPVRTFMGNNYARAIAGMKIYDVLLVNSVIDGMNLVAKEGPVVNVKDGVLILSVSTGAHHQLSSGAISVSPADIEGTMQAMHKAITMGDEERHERAEDLRTIVEQEDITFWLHSQFKDIMSLL
jgi:trehalose 6-phosphate synthase